MRPWSELTHYAGFDWASDHHDVVVVDRAGAIVADFRFPDTAAGWKEFLAQIAPFPALGVAVETCCGAAVERLLQAPLTVFPVNPKAAKLYRERKFPAGCKSDRRDAWSMADALRMDGQGWKALRPEDPLILELRQLCRDESGLIEQRTALLNQLQQALREYYPTALEAFQDWTVPSSWAFVEAFPTPQALAAVGRRKLEKFLRAHRLCRPETGEERLACFARATEFCGSTPTTAAKSLLAVTTVKMLRTLQGQLDEYRARIEDLFNKHPDHNVFGSLPGIGSKTASRLMGEIGSDRERFDTPESLQCYGGTAPVTRQSGKSKVVHWRYACNRNLRFSIHWLADLSRKKCAWAEAYYRKKREEGKSHACALRCLGQRWIKILWKMWQTGTPYDPELHLRNQTKHGSWVLQILGEKVPGKSVPQQG